MPYFRLSTSRGVTVLAVLLVTPAAIAQGAGADSAQPLVFGVPAGAQLRVRLGESRLGGILISASRDTLVLRDSAYFPLRLPIAALTEVDVLRTRRWVRKRMVIGAVTGAAAVALVVGVVHSRLADCDAPCGCDKDRLTRSRRSPAERSASWPVPRGRSSGGRGCGPDDYGLRTTDCGLEPTRLVRSP